MVDVNQNEDSTDQPKLQKGSVGTWQSAFYSLAQVGPAADIAILLVGTFKDAKLYSKNWKVAVGGSGIVRYRDVIERDFKETSDFVRDHLIICEEPNVPPVDVLAQLGHASFMRGGYVQPSLVKPVYLREADAKVGAWKGAAAQP